VAIETNQFNILNRQHPCHLRAQSLDCSFILWVAKSEGHSGLLAFHGDPDAGTGLGQIQSQTRRNQLQNVTLNLI
jgi:hypothetical protein